MIDNNYSFINDFEEKNFIDSNDALCDVKFYRCPKCGSYHIVKNGTYVRKTAINSNESKVTKVQKFICCDCKTSFKYLPLYLTSHSHLTSLTLCKILLNPTSNNKASKIFNVSRNTVRSIKDRFKSVVNQINLILNKSPINSFLELLKSYFDIFDHFLFSPSTTSDRYDYLINSLS